MSSSKNKSQSAFVFLKNPLPQLSMQDRKIVFANNSANEPTTKVLMSIPYYYDIMSAQGVREWSARRAESIEQEDVTTIKTDSLSRPGQFHFTIQPINQFEPIDSKVREIEQFANIMEQDLDELAIPQLEQQPFVEPIFTELPQRISRHRIDDEADEEASSSTLKREHRHFSKAQISHKAATSTDRAREKVRLAEKSMKDGFGDTKSLKKKKSEDKYKKISNEERGNLNWARINQYMQKDDF